MAVADTCSSREHADFLRSGQLVLGSVLDDTADRWVDDRLRDSWVGVGVGMHDPTAYLMG